MSDYERLQADEMHEWEGEKSPAKPLISDYIIGYSSDRGAVFVRHTSEMMFTLTPFQKEGYQYFTLIQFDENERAVVFMTLSIGEMEGLQELLADMIKQRAAHEQLNGGA